MKTNLEELTFNTFQFVSEVSTKIKLFQICTTTCVCFQPSLINIYIYIIYIYIYISLNRALATRLYSPPYNTATHPVSRPLCVLYSRRLA